MKILDYIEAKHKDPEEATEQEYDDALSELGVNINDEAGA